MVSRQETSRPLLTPGEVMQLPPDDEVVLVSGCHPIRTQKARYYEDRQLQARILPPPRLARRLAGQSRQKSDLARGDWADSAVSPPPAEDPANAGIRREPELPEREEVVPSPEKRGGEFDLAEDEPDDDAQRLRILQREVRTVARQASLDPADDMGL